MAVLKSPASLGSAVGASRRLLAELGGGDALDRLRRSVSFGLAWSRLGEQRYRRLVLLWVATVIVIVPSGMLTRLLEWTGIPVVVGGVEIYLTVYLPMLACLPLVIWLGYLWGAIPAYLSTFCVALMGGMPLGWIFVFAFANPIGLAVPAIAYRSLPVRSDLRSVAALFFYLTVTFVASLVGSTGSFVWAYTNRVGLNDLYPVWQGWWLGGFAQASLFCAPILLLAGPMVEAWKLRAGLETTRAEVPSRASILLSVSVLGLAITAYVSTVRYFSLAELDRLLDHIADPLLRDRIGNVVDGFSLPLWVLLAFGVFTMVFGYRAGMAWAASLKRWSESLSELNAKLHMRASDLENKNRLLYQASITDPLTGVYNRSYLMDMFGRELTKSLRHDRPLACVMVDVDRFKQINDRYGHLVGDRALQTVAAQIGAQLRRGDVLARYGGEEFVIVLPETDLGGAMVVAEKIRASVASGKIAVGDDPRQLTISLGVASTEPPAQVDSVDELLRLADEALFEAKRQGRDRVLAASVEDALGAKA